MFYGWKIIATLFLMLMFSSGLGFYNHSVVIQALSRQAGFEVELASLAVSEFFLVSGLTGILLAPALDRYDVRWIVIPGIFMTTICLALLGQVSTLPGLFILYGFFGIGFAAAGLLPATTLVARWFEVARARALSIASTGLSVGGIALTPLSAWMVEKFPLDITFPALALFYLVVVVPPCWLVLRSHPADIGEQPDGRTEGISGAADGLDYRQALRQHFFYGLSISYLLTMCAQVGGITHQYGVLLERLTPGQASVGVGIMPALSVIGRLAGGVLLDRISTLGFTLFMMIFQGVTLIAIGLSPGVFTIYLSLALFGLSVGNLLMLQPLIVAEVYGLKHYARLYSRSNLIAMFGISVGPMLLGWLFAVSGTYTLSYIVAGTLGILGAVVFSLLKPPQWKNPEGDL